VSESGPASPASSIRIHVVAGLLLDSQGRVLLAQRPEGKHLAGLWEFPGGKCEPGESATMALVRELREELGIEAEPGETVMQLPWDYASKSLLLHAMRVPRWHGVPRSCEGQALRWVYPSSDLPMQLAPADLPVMQALMG
jgi:8-oxo-dGTP diphosphatase